MKQIQALALLKAGHSVFLTGQAGAGKTYVLNQFIHFLRENHVPVAITASTGIAATHMNGMTIHAWAGIGIKDKLDDNDFKALAKKDALLDRLKSVRVLIIDEVSMLHARQLDLVDEVLRRFRGDDAPFGGIQVVFSGDFFQLPPIGDKGETTKDKFAFMSKAWIALATQKKDNIPILKVCYLSEQHRQQDNDTDVSISLNHILNQIRKQCVDLDSITALQNTVYNALEVDRVRLYTHNAKVHEMNEKELAAIDEKAHEFQSLSFGDEKLVETLKKQVLAYETLTLKKGAKVMFIKNNAQESVYNGTMGKVTGFISINEQGVDNNYPIVRLNNGKEIVVRYETWSIDDEEGTPLASFSQIPLCLAWAITVHKSQGMTLDFAEIDLSKTFEKGQGYVALSRVKSLTGLKLLGLNDTSLLLDEFAQVADRRFLQLSQECVAWLTHNEQAIIAHQEAFVKQNSLSYDSIKSNTPKSTPSNTSSTSQITAIKEALSTQTSLDNLATQLSLSKMTLINQLNNLLSFHQITKDDIAYLSPSQSTLEKIEHAINTLSDKGEFDRSSPKIRPIFDELREEIHHQTIALALLFLDKSTN